MKNQTFDLPITQMIKNGKVKHTLSEREKEVFQLVADGQSNKQIADTLGVSDDTIDTHNRSIENKLEANNMKHAVAIGMRKKIIK